jgi:hypothetical protein
MHFDFLMKKELSPFLKDMKFMNRNTPSKKQEQAKTDWIIPEFEKPEIELDFDSSYLEFLKVKTFRKSYKETPEPPLKRQKTSKKRTE